MTPKSLKLKNQQNREGEGVREEKTNPTLSKNIERT
jgi:hypothetical protein